jgi:hypothetical protein
MAATHYPLHVPPRPWHTVGLDYLTHLHVSNGFDNVLIVVDHLTRMAHFMPCLESVTAEEIATLFLHGVYKLHGLPRVLVSDRDPKFVINFWHTLWRRLGTRMNMSSSRHQETDGLSERVNIRCQQLLRCLCCYLRLDLTGQTCCLKWNLRTTLLVRSELNTHPSRLIVGSLLRSLLICYSTCDLLFLFHKTRQGD